MDKLRMARNHVSGYPFRVAASRAAWQAGLVQAQNSKLQGRFFAHISKPMSSAGHSKLKSLTRLAQPLNGKVNAVVPTHLGLARRGSCRCSPHDDRTRSCVWI